MDIEDVINLIMKFFPDAPCNYNGMDELADCEFCESNCDNPNPHDCWKNAIENRWWDKI